MKQNIIISIFSIFTFISYAQELKVTSNKNPAIVGEQILIQYTLNENGTNFISPNFNNLQVLSGPNPSSQSSYTIINGKSESTVKNTFSFYLRANKPGTYNIGPASISVNGKVIKSDSYQLKIVKSNPNKKNSNQLSKNLYLKVDVSKRNIVVGEQILVVYKLFTRVDLQNTEVVSLPELNGFWKKELETSSRFKREIIDGVPFNVATIKKSVLTAQKSGELLIDAVELKCSIRTQNNNRSRDPFANFFGGGFNLKEEYINSNPVKIKVSDLPQAPENFTGAVGDMNITSEVNKTKVQANDALSYTIKIIGTGNIELIKAIKPNFPDDFEIYDPKITEKIFEGGRKRSIKTFEYLIIPRFKGEYKIPSLNFTFYNNKKKKYEIKQSSTHNIIVEENTNIEESSNISLNQQIVKSNRKDINYIYTKVNLKRKNIKFINFGLFTILFFIPILIFFISRKLINHQKKSKSSKNYKANKIALSRLKSAQKCIDNKNYDLFYEEIEKSLWGYFADKFNVNISKLSKETISQYFKQLNIDQTTEREFISLIDVCEFARYSPEKDKNSQMDDILNKSKNIIIKVETELK
ncbi:MAG: hypothetical protein CMD34_02910 [Flavobacteriales bacterium]|nr:hypothetical protein [Flavobacteriales bacterium]